MASGNNLPGQRRPLEAQRDGGPEQLRGLQRLALGRHARGYVSFRWHLSGAASTMPPAPGFDANPTTGVISFLPADGPTFGDTVMKSEHLAAINFTGSTKCV